MASQNSNYKFASKTRTRQRQQLAARAASLGVLSLILAISGPFDTYGAGPFWLRLLYWSAVVVVSVLVADGARAITANFSIPSKLLLEAANITLFLAVFLPFLVLWTSFTLPKPSEDQASAVEMGLYVVAICILISIARHVLPMMWARASAAPVRKSNEVEPPKLTRKMPVGFSGDILRLAGEGHHVRVVTTADSFEIRMRLSDAVDDMESADGFWTHRSHWVVRHAVAGSVYRRGKPVLVLKNGDEVPVSGTHAPRLEEMGVLLPRGIETAKA